MSVTMNTLHIPSVPQRITQHDNPSVQRPSQSSASESDATAITESPSFGQLVGQLLGMGQQNPETMQDTESATNNDVISMQGAETPIQPRDSSHQRTDNNKQTFSIQSIEDAPKDGEQEKEIAGTQVNSSDGKKDFAVEVPQKKSPSIKNGDEDNSELDKKIFDLAVKVEEKGPDLLQGAKEILAENEKEGMHVGEGKNGSSNKIDYPSFVQHESSAAQQQTAYAAEVKGLSSAEGGQHARMQATDPAEQFSNTASIVKEGTRLAVKLEPEGLGKLDINVNLRSGMVHAQINVHDDATKSLIDNNMHQLVDALLKEGLSVGGFSVSLHKGDVWEQATEFNREYKEGKGAISPSAASEAVRATVRGLVNIFV
jgi:flagellar hook-length control protein FliK